MESQSILSEIVWIRKGDREKVLVEKDIICGHKVSI
jgi:hypothetical protein